MYIEAMFNMRHELYGESVFTSLRSVDGKVFAFTKHIERLFDSSLLCYGAVCSSLEHFERTFFDKKKMTQLFEENSNHYFRFTLYMKNENQDLKKFKFDLDDLALDIKIRRLEPFAIAHAKSPLKLNLAPYPFSLSYRPIKSGSYTHQLNYKKEAMALGYDDVLFCDESNILELSTSNIVFEDAAGNFTSPLGEHFLQGITLSLFEGFVRHNGKKLGKKIVSKAEIDQYEIAYALNGVSLLTPIKSIDSVDYRQDRANLVSIEFLEYLKANE